MGHYWTEVAVRGVVIDPVTGDPAILLQDETASVIVTIPSDPAGADSIICELEGVHRDAPLSLLYRFFVRHEIRMSRLEIGEADSGRIGAALCYNHNGRAFRMDVQPADGIALAVQAAAPMFASAELVSHQRHRSRQAFRGTDLLILNSDLHFAAG